MSGDFTRTEIESLKQEHSMLVEERDRLSEDVLFKLKMNPTFITDEETRKQLERLHWLDVRLGQSTFVRFAAQMTGRKPRRFSIIRLLVIILLGVLVVIATVMILTVAEQQIPILREWRRS